MRSLKACLVIMSIVALSGCATYQSANFEGYNSKHAGIFPGPDDAISTATAQVIYEKGSAEAELIRTRAKILENCADYPHLCQKYGGDLATVPGDGYDIIVTNNDPIPYYVTVSGDLNPRIIPPYQTSEFTVKDRRFEVTVYLITKHGYQMARNMRVRVRDSLARIPYNQQFYSHHVIIDLKEH
jgi:hypothetical protein